MNVNTNKSVLCSAEQDADTIKYKNFIIIVLFAATAFGILLRILLANNAMLEYDEIWTIQHYSNLGIFQILNDLSVPNNHPLNSIAVKLTYGIFHPEHNTVVFRISSLLSGCLLILAAFLICEFYRRKFSVQSSLVLFAFTLFPLLFSPGLVHYSAILRGYAMQSLFVFVMYVSFLILLTEPHLTQKRKNILSVICVFAAILTSFSITSGIMFCCAAGLSFLIMQIGKQCGIHTIFKRYSTLMTCGIAAGAVVVLWLACHLNDMRNARTFGESVIRPLFFLRFVRNTFVGTGTLPFFILLIASDMFLRKTKQSAPYFQKAANYCYLFVGIILFAALLTGAGPIRVYLPICAPVFFTAALSFAYAVRGTSIRFSVLIALVAFIFCIAGYQIKINDEIPKNICSIFLNEASKLPDSTAVIYPTGSGYEIQFNLNSESVCDETRRHFKKETDTVAVLKNHRLTALDNKLGESEIHIAALPCETDQNFDYYTLVPVTENTELSGKTLVAKILPVSQEKIREINAKLRDAGFLLLNPFLDSSFSTQEDPAPGAFYATDAYPYTLQDLLNFEEDYAPFAQFYVFR